MTVKTAVFLLFCVIPFIISESPAGTLTIHDFTVENDGVHDSNMVSAPSGIALAVNRETTIKLFGDTFPGTPNRTYYSDILMPDSNSVELYFVDTTVKRLIKQTFSIASNGTVTPTEQEIAAYLSNVVEYLYLHVDRGQCGYLASYIQEAGNNDYALTLSNGTQYLRTDSSGSTFWIASTQCHMSADTFIVMSVVEAKYATISKIYSCGGNISVIDTVLALTSGTNDVLNGAIATDSSGTILAVFTRGTFIGGKKLSYLFFNRDLTPGPAGIMTPAICESGYYYFYDDVAVTSYGIGKFALVSWDSKGVLLHKITVSGAVVTHDTVRVVSKSGVKFCTIASSNNYMVIACMGDVDENDVRCVEGLCYELKNGEPVSPRILSYSNPSIPLVTYDTAYSSAMNAVVDDSGTIALTWRNQYKVEECIWAQRSIYEKRAFYRSAIDSLRYNNDSIQFYPHSAVLDNTTYWNTEAFVRVGEDIASCTTASWLSLSDTSLLAQYRTADCYFQTKLYLQRNTAGATDSFSTPVLSSYDIHWNVQPHFIAIDSVKHLSTVYKPFTDNDTVYIISRRDSLIVTPSAYDADNGDAVTIAVSTDATPPSMQLSGTTPFTGTFILHPFPRSDTVYNCTLSVMDTYGWYGGERIVRCKTRNSTPQSTINFQHFISSAASTSFSIKNDTTFIIQEEDSVSLRYTVTDSNDLESVYGLLRLNEQGSIRLLDSITSSEQGLYTTAANEFLPVDTVRITQVTVDRDTALEKKVYLLVNHRPVIQGVQIGEDTLGNGDQGFVTVSNTAAIRIMVHDTDCSFGDTLDYSLTLSHGIQTVKTIQTEYTIKIVPHNNDTVMNVTVVDRFGRADSIEVYLSFPWFETDTSMNSGYRQALTYCTDSLSLICGSTIGDTVRIPLKNSGRDPLYISSFSFARQSQQWLFVNVIHNNDTLVYTAGSSIVDTPLILAPFSREDIVFTINAEQLSGDGMFIDTVTLMTNDPSHEAVDITVRLECNDLPRIVAVNPYFIADTPYRLFTKKKEYHFPPHAHIAVSFSEPMDTATAKEAIVLYSIFDTKKTGTTVPIPCVFTWYQNLTLVHITPDYTSRSPYFNLQPPSGLFIPTDSIAIRLTDELTDRAQTPSGPNALDVDNDFKRQQGADTTITARVDSILFTISAITPSPGIDYVDRDLEIRLDFSSPVYAATVDTTLEHNRSLQVTSVYNNGDVLPFSAITIDSASVTFNIKRHLFYYDSIDCYYTSRWVRDVLGYAADNSSDGIDITIFDSLSHEDDMQWGYRVQPVRISKTIPERDSVLIDIRPEITVVFDGTIPAGAIDLDTSMANQTFSIGSGRTGYSSFRSIDYLSDSTGFVLQPRLTFFSNDSVYCFFKGFSSQYRYAADTNYPIDTINVMGDYKWSFRSGKIGFYTYPNPYKPNSNPRHCDDAGPCGIWFKNLHALANDIDEVKISIYTMNAHPVFDTEKKNIRIRFNDAGTDNLPQWKWDTRNARGELVATGLYLYVIKETNGTMLEKGKLIIVR